MAQRRTRDTIQIPAAVGVGWRTFQLLGFLTAISWLVSYALFLDGYTALFAVFGTDNPLWMAGGIAYFLSPVISLVLIAIAVWPSALSVLNGEDTTALIPRSVLFVIPVLWMVVVFVGGSAMMHEMLHDPLGPTMALPVAGGAFFHVVFQHWFQGLTAIALALAPRQFRTLTDSDRPAGTGAVVRDVTAQMALEDRLAALHEATRDMMAADSPTEIATIASQATGDILDIPHSRVHLQDEATDELVPAAWTDETERVLDGAPPTVDPGSGLVWERFRTGEAGYFHDYDGLDDADVETRLQSSLLLPLGDEGILLVQSTEPAAFTDAKIELAHILSANTQAALARTTRDRELELVRALLDQSSDGVFVIDPETGQFRDANDPACHHLGYSRDELMSLTIHDIVAALPERPDVDTVFQEARDQGMVALEGSHQRKDGSTFPVHLTVNHIELDQEYVLAIARDLTEQKQREEAVAVQRTELDLLGFIQTLIDEIVHQVRGQISRSAIELQACELLSESAFYTDAWFVDPSQGEPPIEPLEETADGGKLRSVDDMAPEAPATEAIQDTIETNRSHVLDHSPGQPVATEVGEVRGEQVESAGESAIALPLTYGESNYGALVVSTDRQDPFGARERSALETLTVSLAFAIHVRMQDHVAQEDALELEFHATESSTLLSTLAATLACPVRLEGLVPGSDDRDIHYYVAETDTEADALRELVQATDRVADCRILDHDEACLFEVQVHALDLLDQIVAAGAVVRAADATPDETHLVIDLPPDTNPQEFRAIVQETPSDWTLTDQRQVEWPMRRVQDACRTLEESLTEKQREALLTAYFAGYYDYPRTNTAQEVADTLAITDSTLFQHLQAAQRKLIEAWLEPAE